MENSEKNVSKIWDTIKRQNAHIIAVPERKENEDTPVEGVSQ